MKVDIITMGCSKNLVDSERLMKLFENAGMEVCHTDNVTDGDIAVVNTCGFIGDAKEESINMILECCRAKQSGAVKAVYVMGCLAQRYRDVIPSEIPEVDGWYGKFDWPELVKDILGREELPDNGRPWDRVLTTLPHSAYIKIAEGCNRFCAFCAIPLITGRFRSRPVEEILDEVRDLVARGVKEFNVIAQDLSSYGLDIYGRQELATLIDRMADIPGVDWIRLHYLYPAQFPKDILEVMARRQNVCRYLDIALQHASDKVLANMRRHITRAETESLLAEIRSKVPGIHIRTTLMVGFPGEGRKEFDELLDFTESQRFERMGAFAYCEEEDTYAARNFSDSVSETTKQKRLAKLMELQEKIALESNESKVGASMRVLIDRETEDYYVGRTEFDSPEVDPEVLVRKTAVLVPGSFVNVRITEAMPFDLIGTPES